MAMSKSQIALGQEWSYQAHITENSKKYRNNIPSGLFIATNILLTLYLLSKLLLFNILQYGLDL